MNIYVNVASVATAPVELSGEINKAVVELNKRVCTKLEQQQSLDTKIFVPVEPETKHVAKFAVFTLERYYFQRAAELHDIEYKFIGIE